VPDLEAVDGTWQVWAVRVATAQRPARDNFLSPGDRCGSAAIDFVVFVLACGEDVVVVDTGFSREAGERRGRVLDLGAGDAVRAVGRRPEDVRTVVLSHLHYDHAGNVADFPNAQVVVQRAELEYTTGPAMRHPRLNHFYEVDDVVGVVRRLYEGTVTVADGDRELRPGLEVRLIAGHTRGSQVVRVHTERGWVVLACDGIHYFDNLAERNPFPAMVDVEQVLDGYERIESLASSPDHIVPGHDPELFARYEPVPDEHGRVIAALHRPPVAAGVPTL
jgi:glyoxylase-like metal-dependent hydrolase (beta-lactamase superfamily II)